MKTVRFLVAGRHQRAAIPLAKELDEELERTIAWCRAHKPALA